MNVNVARDEAMESELLQALNGWSAARPRNAQVTLGPSSLGDCRELLRATIAGDEGILERPRGLDGAAIGTIVGEALEEIFESYMGVQTQVTVTLLFEKLGIRVSGNSDILYLKNNQIQDLKSINGLAEVVREGPSLKNVIQVCAYTLGAVQTGLLQEGASASLVYYDRAGVDKKFVVFTIPWEEVLDYIAIAESRLEQVFAVLDAGSPEESRWGLRDQEPGTCFYFQCPFRLNCWGGADNWVPSGTITTDNGHDAVAEYIRARQAEKDAIAYKREARENLRGIQGVTHEPINGLHWAVSWKPGRNDDRLDVIPM